MNNELHALEAPRDERDLRSKSAVERLVMPHDEAAKWAWEQVKNDCALHDLTVGESSTYFGFFMWGWNYRTQLTKQIIEEA